MKLSNLTRASDHEVESWIIEKLRLNEYQRSKLREEEIVRFSHLYFYKPVKQNKVNVLWRLTILVWPVYIILLILTLPFKWMVTGEWGYGRNFLDKFHYKWARKLNI